MPLHEGKKFHNDSEDRNNGDENDNNDRDGHDVIDGDNHDASEERMEKSQCFPG